MLIIIGETKVSELFGKIFPERGYVAVKGAALINDENAVVISRNGKAEVIKARGVIVEENAKMSTARGVQVITCGNNPKNAVSITSRTNDKITLSLNRAVKTGKGICEPLEDPFDMIEGFSEFDYMSAFAVSLLDDTDI